MSGWTIGLALCALVGGLYFASAWLQPDPDPEDFDQVRERRGDVVGDRFERMDDHRLNTVAIGRVALPVLGVALLVSAVVDLVRWLV